MLGGAKVPWCHEFSSRLSERPWKGSLFMKRPPVNANEFLTGGVGGRGGGGEIE